MKDQRMKVLERAGLREMEKRRKEKIRPTPIATPARDTRGILEARYLKPMRIIVRHVRQGRQEIDRRRKNKKQDDETGSERVKDERMMTD
jgi:hypothetical protein